MEPSDLVRLTSSSRDLHGDKLELEHLQHMAEQINRPTKGRLLIEHRRDIPPYGHWDDARVVEENGYYVLKARQIFYNAPVPFAKSPDLLMAELTTPRQLTLHPTPRRPTIVIDKNNYPSFDVAEALQQSIEREFTDMVVELEIRKELHLPTQITIVLSDYWQQIYPLIAAIGPKILDVVLEETIGDGYKLLKKKVSSHVRNLIRIIRRTRQGTLPHDKPQIVIFEIPGSPFIELYTRTDDVDLIALALKPKKFAKVHERILELNELLKIKEAHFKLATDGNWKFTYVITETGQIIGTKDTMNKREKQIERIKLEGPRAFSIGARVKYARKSPPGKDKDGLG